MTKYDDLKQTMRKGDELSRLEEQMKNHPAGKFSDEAKKEVQKIVYDALNASGHLPSNIKPKDITDRQIKEELPKIQSYHQLAPGNIYQAHTEEIVNNMPESDLEILANKQSIQSLSSEKDQKILFAYANYQSAEDLLNRYRAGRINKEEAELIQNIGEQERARKLTEVTKEAIEKERERQTKEGYKDSRLENVMASLAASAASMSESLDPNNKNYAATSLEENIERAREAYENTTEKNYDFKDAVRTTIKSLGKNKDPKIYTLGLRAIEDPDSLDRQRE